ncbi:MAG: undecaprenyl/decaprenyl-phosphate alpha-N-acetylglucosaminyl 1-phosphate transferase [bacterium]|nr:undecaprenyl/decaprenyl-phosphate alpha-N-acetylglucosaminyl 1-phosphate transferase [bacterium]
MTSGLVIALIAVAFVLGMLLLPLLIKLGHRYRLLDHPGKHKRHKTPVPLLGGTALLVAVWGTIGIGYLIAPDSLADLNPLLPYLFGGALIVYLTGLIDDLRPLSAWLKLASQAAAGMILYAGGLKIDPLSIPFYGQITLGEWSIFLSVLWVIGLSNSINLIDGLDGLAAGVSLVGVITVAIVGSLYQIGVALVFAFALIGFLPAFIVYNRYPAKIFLGDSGSLQIGYYFAVLSLMVPLKSYTAAALYLPLLALGVPLLETGISTVRRLVSGKNVMRADRRHLFHYLSMAGMSPRTVVWVFWLLSVVFGGFSLAMFFWDRRLVFTGLVLFMVVIFGGFYIFMASQSRSGRNRPGPGR